MTHEYRELPDTKYPHLVNAQCACGWKASGYTAGWVALSFFDRHVHDASARTPHEGRE